MARTNSTNSKILDILRTLILQLGVNHIHGILYPITMLSYQTKGVKGRLSMELLERIHEMYPELIDQTEIVRNELIHSAIIINEKIYELLEKAFLSYFYNNDTASMLLYFEEIYQILEKPDPTLMEVWFIQAYQIELKIARSYWKDKKYETQYNIDAAWSIYYSLLKKLKNQNMQIKELNLEFISPLLHTKRNFKVSIPGSYIYKTQSFVTYNFYF